MDQSADYAPIGATAGWTQLGNIAPSLQVQKAGGAILVIVTGRISTSASGTIDQIRINGDGGSLLAPLGRLPTNQIGVNIDGAALFTGLAAAIHTFGVEYQKAATDQLFLRASTQPTLERLSIILHEFPVSQ